MSNNMPIPVYRDDPNCRETFVETVQLGVDATGLARIEFCVLRWDPDPPRTPRRVPVVRLVMPRAVAIALRDQIANMTLYAPAAGPTSPNTPPPTQ